MGIVCPLNTEVIARKATAIICAGSSDSGSWYLHPVA